MKKIMNKFISAGLLIIATSQACTNLDETVYDRVSSNNFPKTDEDFRAVVGNAYINLYPFMTNNNMWPTLELPSDELIAPTRSDGGWADGGQWIALHQQTYDFTAPRIDGSWSLLFTGVSDCNLLIEIFQGLPTKTPTTDKYISELKVLRGLYYWWLLDMFGNVPIVTDFSKADPNPPNNTRAEVYAFIEKEILENVDQVSKAVDLSTYSKINYYVGQMILAKLYLNAQVYTGTPQWTKAITACDNIINDGKYSLSSNYFDNFLIKNEGSKENMFVIPYDKVFAQGFWTAQMSLNSPSLPIAPWNGFSAMEEFYLSYTDPVKNPGPQGAVFDANGQLTTGTLDVRTKSFFVGPQKDLVTGAPLVDAGAESTDPDGPGLNYTPHLNSITAALRQAGARVGKWEITNDTQLNMDNDFAIFRYSDVLLMKAEALWRQNSGSTVALALVNQVRARAGVSNFTTLTADNLLAERGRELWAEGHRRTDLIRFGKFNDAWAFKAATDPHVNIFPIPRTQIQANKNLKQNPGY